MPEENYAKLLESTRAAFNTGKTKPIEWRKAQLRALDKCLEENQEAFVEACKKDLRKPRQEGIMFESLYVRNIAKGILNDIDEWIKDEHVEKNILTLMDTTYIKREPFGVVMVLGAWNYPIQLSLAPVCGALAAGNCVVIKPSELAPATANLMTEVIPKYMDNDCVKVVNCGVPGTTELLKLHFDYIFFTGSPNVGKIIAEAAAKNLTPCTLELGGKCPVYIDDSADVELTARRVVWGKIINSGQTCVAPDYVICSEKVRDQFVKFAKKSLKDFYSTDNLRDSEDLCRMINNRNYNRVKKLLDNSGGRTVLCGENHSEKDLFIDFTIVTDIDAENDSLMSEELFGPVLPIVTAGSPQEAAKIINSREKPLSLYIFSKNQKTTDYIVNNTSSGSVCVNDAIVQLTVETLPFGGVGNSGYGAYHGIESFKTFSHSKSVLVRDFSAFGEWIGKARYPPYSDSKVDTLRFLIEPRKMYIGEIKALFGWAFAIGLGFALAQVMHTFQMI